MVEPYFYSPINLNGVVINKVPVNYYGTSRAEGDLLCGPVVRIPGYRSRFINIK
jgi:hypothetical protein